VELAVGMSLNCPKCGSTLTLNLAVEGLEVVPQTAPQTLEVVPQSRVGGVRSKTRFKYQDQAFLAFWGAYPRKIGKASAFRRWASITFEVEPQIIIEAASKFGAQCKAQGVEQKFIPYPETWLNAGRWDDEIAPDPAELAEKRAQAAIAETQRRIRGEGEFA
jgi:hypothetical protein